MRCGFLSRVETTRIELVTPCLQGRCSPSWATPPFNCCLILKQACFADRFVLMGLSGLEPPTSRLSGVRSNRLSYKPLLWYAKHILQKMHTDSLKDMRNAYLVFVWIRHPLTFPGSHPPSIISRLGLNRRVRYGNGCFPQAHRHRKFCSLH